MALLDLHQVAVLHHLRCFDAEFPPNCSDPPPMSPTSITPPQSTKPLPLPTLPPPEPPQQMRDPATVVGLTPLTRGSSIQQDSITDQADEYDCADYEEYTRGDLCCRVFVDYEVFMKHVLHVPNDWETKWKLSGPTSKVTLMKAVDELVWANSQMLGCRGIFTVGLLQPLEFDIAVRGPKTG